MRPSWWLISWMRCGTAPTLRTARCAWVRPESASRSEVVASGDVCQRCMANWLRLGQARVREPAEAFEDGGDHLAAARAGGEEHRREGRSGARLEQQQRISTQSDGDLRPPQCTPSSDLRPPQCTPSSDLRPPQCTPSSARLEQRVCRTAEGAELLGEGESCALHVRLGRA